MFRPEIVEKLADAGFDGMMTAADGTNSTEVLCATLTMTWRCISYIKEKSGPEKREQNLAVMRDLVQQLLTQMADDTKVL